MATNISLTNIATFQNDSTAVAATTANNAAITTAFQDVLSRSGTSPNTMSAPIDMNSNRILNLPTPTNPTDPVRIEDLGTLTGLTSALVIGTTPNGVIYDINSTTLSSTAAGTTGQVLTAQTSAAPIWTTPSTGTIGSSGGFVNILRNATFDMWQRGNTISSPAATNTYTADGWIVNPTGATVSVAKVTNTRTSAATLSALQITGATSVTGILVTQRIESLMSAPIESDSTTFQAQIFNNTGATITPKLSTSFPTVTDNWGASTTDLAAVNLQSCPNGQWTQVAYTFTASSNASRGYAITIDLGNNFSTSGKTCLIAEVDVRNSTGVTTGLNSTPPIPELRPQAIEQLINYRYLYYLPEPANGGVQFLSLGVTSSTTAAQILIQYPIVMRQAAVIFTDAVGNWKCLRNGGGGSLLSTITNNASGQSVGNILITLISADFLAGAPTFMLGGGGAGFLSWSTEL